ncbi:MAG TPA: response regulator transcription factor [Methylibium sp.]|uniref:response regulator transcription factor n=1 Tax=Methylibium sp. TaxID=2067992 RepID=UPI002DBCB64D|nr:response regulator transcription factor [Methylibium sp.]HEU4460463.1 response regulator transcription factor [Methylibium sp.]
MPNPLKVYLVEDDPLVSQHVRDAFEDAPGIRCVGHANRLAIAREDLPHVRPDVLLTDLGLPDGDGTDLIGELSHAPAIDGVWHPHILVFSVFGDEARVIRAIEAGADGYFLKGCTAEELVQAVEQAARGESPISPAIARHLLKRFREPAPLDDARRAPAASRDELHAAGGPVSGLMDFDDARDYEISVREHEVLRLVAQGYVGEEIAERLLTTPRAVAAAVRNVYRKLQLGQRSRLAAETKSRPGWA